MKKILLASAALAMLASAASADMKVGIILGFTGPIESLTPGMAAGAELAMKEASDSGQFLGGQKVIPVRGDSTCVDAAAATAVAERLITSDGVAAIMGADCSGVTTSIANNVAVPNGVVMVSPSATSPALSTIEDNGYFFRTAPSDARQGQVLADVLSERGIKSVAVTYTNNDYGKGLAESFSNAHKAKGGKIEMSAAHEDGKADYSAEVGALAASGAEHLAVFGYLDQGGKGIIQNAIDTGAFEKFILADGMIGQTLIDAIGADLNGAIGTLPGSESEGAATFLEIAKAGGMDGDGPFRGESYGRGGPDHSGCAGCRLRESRQDPGQDHERGECPGREDPAGPAGQGAQDSGGRRPGQLRRRIQRRIDADWRDQGLLQGTRGQGRQVRDPEGALTPADLDTAGIEGDPVPRFASGRLFRVVGPICCLIDPER